MRRASVEIEAHLRAAFFEHLGRLSFSFYDRTQGGQLISRGNSDIRMIQMFLAFGPMIAISMLSFVAALVLMLQMSVLLTLATSVTLPFVYQLGMSMRKRLFPISWMMQARLAEIATITEESVTGTRVVKSFAAEPRQISIFERAARRWRWAFYEQINNQTLSLALLLLYGGYLVIHNEITLGSFVAFSSYLVMLQVPFMMLGMLMMMAQTAAASAQRVIQVLDEQPEIFDRPGAVDLVDCRGKVDFDNVTFAYDEGHPVLDGFSLHLAAGETVALVGRTGSGKSTVARLVPRFYDVGAGAVRVDGIDVRDLTLTSLRSHVGLVLDEPFLFSASVRDNITFGRPDAGDDEVVAAARAAGAHEFILQLEHGYETVIGERGYDLSGGQRQRIAIARTLIVNPQILILDDATSSVDVQREHEIHEALSALMDGRTTLVIAHRLSTINLADRIVVLDHGAIVADGSHAELLENFPLYGQILAHIEASAVEEQRHADELAEEARVAELSRAPFARPPFERGR
jgi:ATP-binding cassette, subfamily B, bacterial